MKTHKVTFFDPLSAPPDRIVNTAYFGGEHEAELFAALMSRNGYAAMIYRKGVLKGWDFVATCEPSTEARKR